MSTRTILICGAVALALVSGVASAQTMALAPGDPVPPLVAWNLDGKIETVEWHGITLVNFWATWCEPCREEMPVLQELHSTYGGQDFRVLGITKDVDVSLEEILEFLEEHQVEYPILKPDQMAHWDFVRVVPMSFLIDDEGKVIRKYVGSTPEQIEGLKRDVGDLLHGRPMGPLVMPELNAD